MPPLPQDGNPVQLRQPAHSRAGWLVLCFVLQASFGLILLGLRPDLDLDAAGWFFEAPGAFAGMTPAAHFLRAFASILPFAIYFGEVMLYLAWLAGRTWRFSPSHRGILFLTLSFALGPGLLVNGVFKAHFHRPRPVHIQEFGGAAPFQPFYHLDGACAKNCSFPSGETAAAFWTLAPALLAPAPFRLVTVTAALIFGIATGALRMAAGAHFLSDVVFSGGLMAALTFGLWCFLRASLPAPERHSKRHPKTGLQDGTASL